MNTLLRATLALTLALSAAPPVAWAASIQIEGAWAREAPPMAQALGVFMTVKNTSDQADRLLRAESPIAKATEIHQTRMMEGMAQMEPAAHVEIPARGEAALKPGGYHIMLIGPHRPYRAGERIPLTLFFERAGKITIEVPVKAVAGGPHGAPPHAPAKER